VLPKADVEQIRRKSSKAPDSPAWKNYPGEMAKKCAIRRLCKTLPLTIEAREAIEVDDRRHHVIDVESEESKPQTSAERLDQALGRAKPQESEGKGNELWEDNLPEPPESD